MVAVRWYLGVLMLLTLAGMSAAQTTKPNILFILVDDMGYNDLGVMGSPDIKTPNIDRLARQGAKFTTTYSMGRFCSPARAGILTGITPAEYGHTKNPAHSMEDTQSGLPIDLTLLPETLNRGGYRAIMIGKWHLGFSAGHHPLNRGFTNFFGFLGGKFTYNTPRFFNEKEDIMEYMYSGFQKVSSVDYLTTEFTDRAMQFATESRNMDRPFFTYLSYNAPHSPYVAPEEDLRRAREAGASPDREVHVAMMQNLDANVGRLYNHLNSLGILENTLIVFTNDNGGHKDGANNFPLRDFKSSWFEGGVRVPFFMYWKGTIKRNQTIRHPMTLLDIYPTFQSVARIGMRKRNPLLQGKNLMPHVARVGQRQAPRPAPIHERIFLSGGTSGVIIEGRWKVIASSSRNKVLGMFDLNADVSERTDLKTHPDHSERAQAMLSRYVTWNRGNALAPAFSGEPVATPIRVNMSRPTRNVVRGRWYTINATASHMNGRRMSFSWENYRTNLKDRANFRHLRSPEVNVSFNANKTRASVRFTKTGNWTIRVNVSDGRFVKWTEWDVTVRNST